MFQAYVPARVPPADEPRGRQEVEDDGLRARRQGRRQQRQDGAMVRRKVPHRQELVRLKEVILLLHVRAKRDVMMPGEHSAIRQQ